MCGRFRNQWRGEPRAWWMCDCPKHETIASTRPQATGSTAADLEPLSKYSSSISFSTALLLLLQLPVSDTPRPMPAVFAAIVEPINRLSGLSGDMLAGDMSAYSLAVCLDSGQMCTRVYNDNAASYQWEMNNISFTWTIDFVRTKRLMYSIFNKA